MLDHNQIIEVSYAITSVRHIRTNILFLVASYIYIYININILCVRASVYAAVRELTTYFAQLFLCRYVCNVSYLWKCVCLQRVWVGKNFETVPFFTFLCMASSKWNLSKYILFSECSHYSIILQQWYLTYHCCVIIVIVSYGSAQVTKTCHKVY